MVEKFVRAGDVCKKGRVKARELAKPGVKFLDLAEGLEKFLKEQDAGCALAFPVNLGANNNAAHYTPTADDTTVVGEGDVLKIDFGMHCDGFIVDNSITVDFGGGHGKLLEAADQALQDALSAVRPGVDSKEVGRVIEEAIAKRGFRPIENLCGHAISHFDLHAGVEIPNVARNGGHIFEEGEVFAIEPFATDGDGRVREDGTHTEIYSLVQAKPVRLQASRQLLSIIASDYATLPFAKRWLQEFPSLNLALNDLTKQGMLHSYSLLRERQGALVSQAETTVIVEADGVKVLVE
ncbi:type II methionyl aminopeptidase [Candidatus Micrarchaeota archaeon]|nr:type II methionyl aminopeptidase [Candidatus Micrarchaeota archaeon]